MSFQQRFSAMHSLREKAAAVFSGAVWRHYLCVGL